MFSDEPRCRYGAHAPAEVICQFRFPEILAIPAKDPVEFQEAIREAFPQFQRRQELPAPKIMGTPGNLAVQKPQLVTNFQFASADGVWRVNLTSRFISLSCSRYLCWEEFARHLDQPLAAFIQIYKPAYFDRIGLRYVNFLSRFQLGLEGVPFRELIEPCWLGPLGEEDIAEKACGRSSVDAEMGIRGGCRVKVHAGPGMIKRNGKQDSETKFIFDQDLYMPGQIPVNLSAGALQTLHAQAFSIFRGAITDRLHDALDPK